MKRLHFVFDVESIGLHGEGFAAGFVVIDDSGAELASGRFSCPPTLACDECGRSDDAHYDCDNDKGTGEADRAWVAANVPAMEPTCDTPYRVRSELFLALECSRDLAAAKEAQLVIWAECGWPVEARFLADAMDYGETRPGPYPLHEIATAMFCAGMDPMATYDRLPNELPKHDPLADARQSARLLIESLNKINKREGG